MTKIPGLRITARRDGFRRAGIDHPATPVDHPVDSLTRIQIAQIKAEPALVVSEIEIDLPEPDKSDKPAPKRAGKSEAKSETKA